jgi:hypothetical protein
LFGDRPVLASKRRPSRKVRAIRIADRDTDGRRSGGRRVPEGTVEADPSLLQT